MEAFSDGVIAVAITLLVLDIKVPAPIPPPTRGLAHALGHEWPSYGAYAVSFLTIGIIWINHHVMIGRLREADHSILILNLVLLATIGLLPFATNLLSSYLNQARGERLAAGVYAGAFLAMAVAFAVLNTTILLRKPHLLQARLSLERRRQILVRSISGVGPYVVATGLAFVSPYVSLAICGALALFYALPVASGVTREAREP